MTEEIEARFLHVDHDGLRAHLRSCGAVLERPEGLMKRVIIDYPDQRLQAGDPIWGFVRVRQETDRTVFTYKQIQNNEARTTHEIEVEVSSYEKTIELFERIGLRVISEQHNKREIWQLDECEVAEKLGYHWSDRIVGNVVDAYRMEYPGMRADEGIRDIPLLTFAVMPGWLKERKT